MHCRVAVLRPFYPRGVDPAIELPACRVLVADAPLQTLEESLSETVRDALVLSALEIARRAHQHHRRDEGSPYLVHPLRVAGSLAAVGSSPAVVAAALLHDVIEDAPAHSGEVYALGPAVSRLVEALTEDWGEWPDEYYSRIVAAGRDAARIKLADRIDNLRFLHLTSLHKQVRYVNETNRHFGAIVAAAEEQPLADALVALVSWHQERLRAQSPQPPGRWEPGDEW